MTKLENTLCLDVGEKRIGVAFSDSSVAIAIPSEFIEVDGSEIEKIHKLIRLHSASVLIVGYPRNQSGEKTKQTEYVEGFIDKLNAPIKVVFQDESLTSVLAEQNLMASGKVYKKGDIDSRAAAMILQDYLEQNYGR